MGERENDVQKRERERGGMSQSHLSAGQQGSKDSRASELGAGPHQNGDGTFITIRPHSIRSVKNQGRSFASDMALQPKECGEPLDTFQSGVFSRFSSKSHQSHMPDMLLLQLDENHRKSTALILKLLIEWGLKGTAKRQGNRPPGQTGTGEGAL